MPVNYLLIESLYEFYRYYGDEFRVEYPTGSGNSFSLSEIADDLARRVTTLFLKDAQGVRPVMAAYPMLQADPRSQDLVLFHEYFHGDNGRGVGASHQTGWSGLVALLLQPRMMKLSHVAPDAASVAASVAEDTAPSHGALAFRLRECTSTNPLRQIRPLSSTPPSAHPHAPLSLSLTF